MLITTANSPYTRTARPSAPASPPVTTEAVADSFVATPASSSDEEKKIAWGPVLGIVGGYAAASGLAAAGLGWMSAVPAFVVGGATGLAVSAFAADAVLNNGKDSSATGPLSLMVGAVGGVASAFGAATLALNHGSLATGLGVAAAATGLAAAGGAYLRYN